MKSLMDGHGRWRELIATRLNGPLTRSELRSLSAHLRSCPACRQVDRDYREQRLRMRSLAQPIPPRDLWARTSAALDREVARGSYRDSGFGRGFDHPQRRLPPSAALMTSLAAIGVIAAITVMQFAPVAEITPPPAPPRATPWTVSAQELAFIGLDASEVYVYRTKVNQVCPASAPDCSLTDEYVRTRVQLPRTMRTSTAALSPTGERLAVVGSTADEDVIAVLILPPEAEPADPLTTAAPTADGVTETPAPTDLNVASTTQPTDPPDGPSAQPTASQEPVLATPIASDPAPVESEAPQITAPPATAVPGLRVVPILEDVQSAGAPPAWSPSGEVLAFSAMPADGSHGPDVYIWSQSDETARAITTDHASFFASWSGERIVASRAVLPADEQAEPHIETVVIDPSSLEERVVAVPSVWLPQVSPQLSHAVVWHGQFDWSNGLPTPQIGSLYMLDWDAVDPFASEPVDPTPSPTDDPTAAPTDDATPSPTALPTSSPTSSPIPTATEEPSATEAPSETASALPDGSPAEAPTGTATNVKAEPTASPSPAPSDMPSPDQSEAPATFPPIPEGLDPLDPGRDPLSAPVVDWQVKWSSDGQVLGVWVADVPGSSWGSLVVTAIDAQVEDAPVAEPLLPTTLARRGFTLGQSRVAWVAPVDGNDDGELRVRTWSSDGVGGLRVGPHDLEEVVPAF